MRIISRYPLAIALAKIERESRIRAEVNPNIKASTRLIAVMRMVINNPWINGPGTGWLSAEAIIYCGTRYHCQL